MEISITTTNIIMGYQSEQIVSMEAMLASGVNFTQFVDNVRFANSLDPYVQITWHLIYD